ncbi:MAG: hypothetical protein IPO93_04280 [Actinobacteria bacterium]|jgi:hypothetical protein|nr:hypothetical protein [Actinomycetota bacterium]
MKRRALTLYRLRIYDDAGNIFRSQIYVQRPAVDRQALYWAGRGCRAVIEKSDEPVSFHVIAAVMPL